MRIRPGGFAVVWGAEMTRQQALTDWAIAHGAVEMCAADSFRVFGLGDCLPEAWTNESTSGVFLGELYAVPPDENSAALTAANRIASIYAEQGEQGLAQLEGVFCTAFRDAHRQQLVLYRDTSCGRALYWSPVPGGIAVATRLDILASMPGVDAAIGSPGLHEYLRFLDVSPPNTIYRDVHALEPGQPAVLRDRTPQYPTVHNRKNSRSRARAGPAPSFETCTDALDEALRASISARMNRGRPTGVFLSGGIDSALICAIAADIDRNAVDAFTLGFHGRDYDESPVATSIAAHLGVRHHRIEYSMAEYAQAFEDFVAGIDLPFADPAGLPTLMLYRDCRKTVDAVLDGTGADTLLGVMPARHLRFATQYAALLPRDIRKAICQLLRRLPHGAAYTPLFDFDAPEELLIRWKGWPQREIERLCDSQVDLTGTRFFRIYRRFGRAQHLERYSALMGNLPDDRVHQAAELAGLRVRFPYWDNRVESLLSGLPWSYRYTEAEPKRLLRAVLGRYVPQHLWDRPKHGFDFPFIELMRFDDGSLLRRHLTRSAVESHGLIGYETARHFIERFNRGDKSVAFKLWALLLLFAWLEHPRAPK